MTRWPYTYLDIRKNWGIFLQIRYRNIVRDKNNVIVSGSATLVENSYQRNATGDRSKNHTKQTVVESLGKVIWINEANSEQAIFDSPTRGLVFYNLGTDTFEAVNPTDSRLTGTNYQEESKWIHVNFGNPFLFFNEMEKTPFMQVVRDTFTDTRLCQKVLAHLAHDCLKNGSSIKCGEFLRSSILSYILKDIPVSTLDCDSSYFSAMANDVLKTTFFKKLIEVMRKTKPDFGRCCYVDSTPLPGEAENNPFNALSSHGTESPVIQSRLVLLLDIQDSIPVWFEIIPSNVLDKSTIMSITDDVKETLGIDIDVYDLDAGYARQELFQLFNRNNSTRIDEKGQLRERSLLVRMPDLKGYGRNDLYIQCKPNFYKGRYSFDYEHHTFFGERVEIELFDQPEYAFVFVDKTQAEALLRNWRSEHQEEWDALSDLAQDWYMVKDGFFVLIGNKDQSPRDTLIEYRSRVKIEFFFRDAKSYLKILPIAKWTKQTVTGKIFHDMIETIFYRTYRKRVEATNLTMSSLIVSLNGWEAYKITNNGLLELKTSNAQIQNICESLGYKPSAHFDLEAFADQMLNGNIMSLEPITKRSRRKVIASALSPEETKEAQKREQIERLIAKEAHKKEAAQKKANRILSKSREAAKAKIRKIMDKAKKKLDKSLAEMKRESTKKKAQELYQAEMADAVKEYKQSLAIAQEIYTKAVAEAETVFNSAVSEIRRSSEETETQEAC